TSEHDYVVSSLRPRLLKQFLATSASNQGMKLDPQVVAACEHSDISVSVMVVNLYYSNPDLIPPSTRDFGYLIPRSVPIDQNPERALGVIFSSETSGRDGSVGIGRGLGHDVDARGVLGKTPTTIGEVTRAGGERETEPLERKLLRHKLLVEDQEAGQ